MNQQKCLSILTVISFYIISVLLLPETLYAKKSGINSLQPDVLYAKSMSRYKSLQASKDKKKYRHSWQKAISQFEVVYKKFPKSAEAPKALYMMGKLYYGLYGYSLLKDDLLQSINEYRRVVTKYPKSNLADDAQLFIAEIYEKKLKNLDFIRNAMGKLSFREGSPYQYPSSTRCYVPYYGKDQVIRFIQTVKPRIKNDISKLTA